MNIMIFDTETVSLNKPFCYNIGYCIYDTNNRQVIKNADYVVEQIWHNRPLFETAYYADKRPLYISMMKAKHAQLLKYGEIMRRMRADIKAYDIQSAYAYNSPFDDNVFRFNCEWFKCINPLDNVSIFDIRGYAHKAIATTPNYLEWAERNSKFTESGNYSTTAETIYQYLSDDLEFVEDHTALSDSQIETTILVQCIDLGCAYNIEYPVLRSIPRNIKRTLHIRDNANNNDYYFEYSRKRKMKNDEGFYLDI